MEWTAVPFVGCVGVEGIRFLRDRGPVAVSELENAFGVTRSRVNQIVKPLVDQGIVHRIGQTRATRYFLK